MDDKQQIHKEACAWIARLHDAEPDSQLLSQFHQWIEQSPEHLAEIRSLAKLWGELNILTELAVLEPEVRQSHFKAVRTLLLSNRRWQLVSAVCGFLVLVVGLLLFNPEFSPNFRQVYATAIGEQKTVELPDGSTLLLNTNSLIKVDYSRDERNLYLIRGQAHFQVAHNSDRPFNVYAGKGMVRAVGTAFSVYLKGSLVDVMVTEGSVQLNSVDAEVSTGVPEKIRPEAREVSLLAVVKAGQNATLDQKKHLISSFETMDKSELDRRSSWRQGLLRFSGDPLQSVVEEVSRYTPLQITIEDPGIRDLRIGGFFQIGQTEKMFQALESGFGVKVVYLDSTHVVLRAADTTDL